MLATILAFVFVGLALVVLVGIVRFSIISPVLRKGAERTLRKPQVQGIDATVGFSPSPELLAFYRQSPFLEKKEFYLVDRANTPPTIWPIGEFQPLTVRIVRENLRIARVDGIPIADDLDKGMYYVTKSGAVRLRSPDVVSGDVHVASSITSLLGLEFHDHWPGGNH
jgi:hypothetical protein